MGPQKGQKGTVCPSSIVHSNIESWYTKNVQDFTDIQYPKTIPKGAKARNVKMQEDRGRCPGASHSECSVLTASNSFLNSF